MQEVIIFVFNLLNISFEIAGIDLTLGSVVLGTILISFLCAGIRAMFN